MKNFVKCYNMDVCVFIKVFLVVLENCDVDVE